MKFTRIIAILAAAASLTVAGVDVRAQTTVAPKEFPPVNYRGRQYVDSAGCAFIRAGVDDAVQWVPRVTRDRRLICGLKPTFTVREPAPQAPAAGSQEVLVLSPAPAPAVARPGVPKRTSTARGTSERRAEPNLVGTVVTPANAAAKGVTPTMRVMPRHVYEARRNTLNVKVPKGYRTVWEDDRLNPRRAEQTLTGHAAMHQVWTKTVPRRLID
ncbi:hypothetical protein [uncultured Roseobacter sp.]|uniref:hypothetical protein n=1 Tax=uncultured Roseobacter sp. TaxID=114847 RepID=UPI0026365EA7|nr:hypothetical protein [uncultured Roseobacter sp.]